MVARGKAASGFELFLLGLLGLLWGAPYALTKIALTTIPPVTLVAGRVSLAATVLWIFVLFRRKTMPRWRRLIPAIIIQGLIACAIPYTLIAFGQRSVDSALAAILNSTTPLFVCLVGVAWVRQESLTAARWFGVTIGLGGVVMIAGGSALLDLGRTIPGQLAIVAATFSSALSAIYGRRFADIAPEMTAAATLTSAALVLVPLCLLLETPFNAAPSTASLSALAVNGVVATALGFALYFRLIQTLGSMGVASVGYLKPGFGVLIACTLVGETMTWVTAGGLIAILIGVVTLSQGASASEGEPGATLDAKSALNLARRI